MDSAVELDTVIEGIDSEKTSKICEISHIVALVLVVLIFAFFPFSVSVRDCDMVGGLLC